MQKIFTSALFLLIFQTNLFSQDSYNKSKFHQLEEIWPTPNTYRTASGSPGVDYWQQKADYDIKIELNDKNQSVKGSETITYTNNSPDALSYLWVQLDQNIFDPNSMTYLTETRNISDSLSFEGFDMLTRNSFDGGYKISSVKDGKGTKLKFTINNTMMRIDLSSPLKSKGVFQFSIDWENFINNARTNGGRGGYEYFKTDNNYLYEMAQWFPRMAVYDDVDGWQNKQYLGNGEFALTFGDYKVAITVPADHVVTATGVLQNAGSVLSKSQQNRLKEAENSKKPILVITPAEALENEKSKSESKKTWIFNAENVRDFAWASSKKFIWDALGVKVGNKTVMAMSLYPKEGNPLWELYSTQAIAQTLLTYSRYTVNYPYPVAISVNGPIGGMEYPMICFNGPRPETDGTYSSSTKYALIGVVIHEVGHNYFPMIINSDERQWTWMDEGLNTFCQYLTEQEWEENYPSSRGEARNIVNYMSSNKDVLDPIMTNSESILQFGNNAYGKPATALNILRETVMGRELFDFAFKQYAEKWAFKHPMPSDFFRTMEDASAVDLDWFWRGWFYGTDPVDISLNKVSTYKIDTRNPEKEKTSKKQKRDSEPLSISEQRNKTSIKKYRVEDYPELSDFYSKYDALDVTDYDKGKYKTYYDALDEKQRKKLESGMYYYVLDLENVGGLVSPVIIELEFANGEKEVQRIPAEIWRKNSQKVSKLLITDKAVKQFSLDPFQETADINRNNNFYPAKTLESPFQLFKERQIKQQNLMQLQRDGKL